MPLTDDDFQKIAVGARDRLNEWRWGAHLVAVSGESVSDLHCRAVVARIELSERLRIQGHLVLTLNPPHFRLAISRFYYSMYHSARAIVFYDYVGDDYEAHSALPKKLPIDFPNAQLWRNDLKNAREMRNSADYDAFPRDDAQWQPKAITLRDQSDQFVNLARPYLLQKGCKYL